MECYLMGWDEVDKLVESVAAKIRQKGYKPDVIIGLSRGGMVPARLLSDRLGGSRDLISIKVEHWGVPGKATNEAKITAGLNAKLHGKKVLLVDDLTDTGDSLKVAAEHVMEFGAQELKTAVMQHKGTSRFKPDYYGEKMPDWKWVIYPWMVHEDVGQFIEKMLTREMSTGEIAAALKKDYALTLGKRPKLLDVMAGLEHRKRVERRASGKRVLWRRA